MTSISSRNALISWAVTAERIPWNSHKKQLQVWTVCVHDHHTETTEKPGSILVEVGGIWMWEGAVAPTLPSQRHLTLSNGDYCDAFTPDCSQQKAH
jgi:hypothetical protein